MKVHQDYTRYNTINPEDISGGKKKPNIDNSKYFKKVFYTIEQENNEELVNKNSKIRPEVSLETIKLENRKISIEDTPNFKKENGGILNQKLIPSQ